jgi:L-alanine-DL-glutamate epimerase-like enolase superfamily enzyme
MSATLFSLPLAEPFRIAHGTSMTRTVLRVTRDGHSAEAPFVPYYGEDPAETLAAIQRGTPPAELSRTARLAYDLLQHDIAAATAGQSLGDYVMGRIGQPSGPTPPGCRSLGIPEDLDVFSQKVTALASQFHVLKLKLGSGDLGLDLAIVSVARLAAPEASLLIDVNGGWDLTEAPLMIWKLMDYRPTLIEQPLHHSLGLEAWRDLRAEMPEGAPPIFADESAQSVADLAGLAGYADGVNVKLLKCGSLDGAIDMIAGARHLGLGVLLGCMIESSLGTTAAAHLAPWADWIDLDGHFYLAHDDYEGIAYAADGSLVMPARPGIGAVPR